MLTKEQNERLTQVGPGTPMGELMRRYWHPIAASAEVKFEKSWALTSSRRCSDERSYDVSSAWQRRAWGQERKWSWCDAPVGCLHALRSLQ